MSSHERPTGVDGATADDVDDVFADVSPAAVMALDDEESAGETETAHEVGALLADGLGDD